MASAVLISYAVAIALLAAAIALYLQSQREAFSEKVNRRMVEWSGVESRAFAPRQPKAPPWVERLFWRAGIEFHGWYVSAALLAFGSLGAVGALWKGFPGALSVPAVALLALYLWLLRRAKKREALILIQLPLFLDQVLRGLGTGRSMDGALALAAGETPAPLSEIIERVLRVTELGADLGSVVQDAADLYRVKELHLLALAIRINRNYGSSVRELLQNVIRMIQQREAARRELRALTGETRISAWILGLLPPAMAAYMMAMNPGYLEGMWEDSTGRVLLIIAVALQIAGAFVLWRMVKSI